MNISVLTRPSTLTSRIPAVCSKLGERIPYAEIIGVGFGGEGREPGISQRNFELPQRVGERLLWLLALDSHKLSIEVDNCHDFTAFLLGLYELDTPLFSGMSELTQLVADGMPLESLPSTLPPGTVIGFHRPGRSGPTHTAVSIGGSEIIQMSGVAGNIGITTIASERAFATNNGELPMRVTASDGLSYVDNLRRELGDIYSPATA